MPAQIGLDTDNILARLLQTLNAVGNGIAIVDSSGRFIWVNLAFTQLTGYTADEVIGQNPRILKSGFVSDAVYKDLWSTITAGRVWTGDLINRRRDGTIYIDHQTITPVRGDSGEISHYFVIRSDETERRQREEHLRFLSTHDSLTGLLNRRGFIEELERHALEDASPGTRALLMIDLDHFKTFNDAYGQAAGDSALVAVAGAIRGMLRSGDQAGRVGGDQFAVLLTQATEDEAMAMAVQLRRSFHVAMPQLGQVIPLPASIGIVMVRSGTGADQIMALAEDAMTEARSSGKKLISIIRSDLEGERQTRNEWLTRLRTALDKDQFLIYYQPIVRLPDGKTQSWEALIRLQDPQEGLLLPGMFLPHAFHFNLTPNLDLWVVQSVLRRMAENPEFNVAANLSAQTFQDQEALAAIEQAVIKQRPKPGQLTLEISETAAVRDLQRVNSWMQKMKRLGCRFALDDFGTGASSFEHLRSLEVDVVKIDGSYVQQVLTDRSCLAFVQAVGSICRAMNKDTVAEGVEEPGIVDLLAQSGIRLGQGFLWGRPAPLVCNQPLPIIKGEGNVSATAVR